MIQNQFARILKKKVYAYILTEVDGQERLLVFDHVQSPEAGIQIPGGSVEPGEHIAAAVMREGQEETGISNFQLIRKLGVVKRDMVVFGLAEVHERHYFLLRCENYPGDTWIAYEDGPPDGSQGPIPFRYFLVEMDDVPVLAGGMDEMLPKIIQKKSQVQPGFSVGFMMRIFAGWRGSNTD